jgi:hypothetical protein
MPYYAECTIRDSCIKLHPELHGQHPVHAHMQCKGSRRFWISRNRWPTYLQYDCRHRALLVTKWILLHWKCRILCTPPHIWTVISLCVTICSGPHTSSVSWTHGSTEGAGHAAITARARKGTFLFIGLLHELGLQNVTVSGPYAVSTSCRA